MKNGGYSLVEVMVVVAILAVAVAVVVFSINNFYALDVQQCAKDIASELGKEKIACMTRTGDVYLRLYKGTDGAVYIDRYENDVLTEQGVKVGKATVRVTYHTAPVTDGTKLDTGGTALDNTGIVIAFNRSDGSFMTAGQAWRLYEATSAHPDDYYTQLTVSSNSSSRSIILWSQTGKFTYTG
jgi:prepilin-type N-terminal cleavage/methylation domain-containing protein